MNKIEYFNAKLAYTTTIIQIPINLNDPNEFFNEFPDYYIIESGTILQEKNIHISDLKEFIFKKNTSFYLKLKNECDVCDICYDNDVIKKCNGCSFKICYHCIKNINQCPQRCGSTI